MIIRLRYNFLEDIIIMKDKIFGVLQRVGRSFMLPIALLPVAGLLLGIGSSFTNATTIETYHLGKFIYEGGVLYTILDLSLIHTPSPRDRQKSRMPSSA